MSVQPSLQGTVQLFKSKNRFLRAHTTYLHSMFVQYLYIYKWILHCTKNALPPIFPHLPIHCSAIPIVFAYVEHLEVQRDISILSITQRLMAFFFEKTININPMLRSMQFVAYWCNTVLKKHKMHCALNFLKCFTQK